MAHHNLTREVQRGWKGFKQAAEYCPTSGKVCYDKRGAQTAANARWDEARVALRIYPCGFCCGWHLTKRVTNNQSR